MSVSYATKFKFILVENLGDFVYNVVLNRPKQRNALTNQMWTLDMELKQAFDEIDKDPNCRVVILSGNGKSFCAGNDIADLSTMFDVEGEDVARTARRLQISTQHLQQCISAAEKCCKPVIAAIHGHCLGGGIEITSCCDIRFCTRDAEFSVKEVQMGFAAGFNRLSHIIGNHSWMRDICMSGRHFLAEEALKFGFVSRIHESKDELDKESLAYARNLASLSPVAVTGIKNVLNFVRDHSINDSLKFVELWNMSQTKTGDISAAVSAIMQKKKPYFAKL